LLTICIFEILNAAPTVVAGYNYKS